MNIEFNTIALVILLLLAVVYILFLQNRIFTGLKHRDRILSDNLNLVLENKKLEEKVKESEEE